MDRAAAWRDRRLVNCREQYFGEGLIASASVDPTTHRTRWGAGMPVRCAEASIQTRTQHVPRRV